jgi:hypothetical protein
MMARCPLSKVSIICIMQCDSEICIMQCDSDSIPTALQKLWV